jgi:hypothetical protein
MDIIRFRPVLIWIVPTLVFAACWGWGISSWGAVGLYAGWIPAAIAARLAGLLASVLWSLIALAALLGWPCYASERGGPFGPAR